MIGAASTYRYDLLGRLPRLSLLDDCIMHEVASQDLACAIAQFIVTISKRIAELMILSFV